LVDPAASSCEIAGTLSDAMVSATIKIRMGILRR
jgi:hypothetical protein